MNQFVSIIVLEYMPLEMSIISCDGFGCLFLFIEYIFNWLVKFNFLWTHSRSNRLNVNVSIWRVFLWRNGMPLHSHIVKSMCQLVLVILKRLIWSLKLHRLDFHFTKFFNRSLSTLNYTLALFTKIVGRMIQFIINWVVSSLSILIAPWKHFSDRATISVDCVV